MTEPRVDVGGETTYHEARARALFRELDAEPELQILSNIGLVAPFNPDFGLIERYGDRIAYPPVSEFAMLGMGVGSALAGGRVFVAVTTATFVYYGWPPVVTEAPFVRYLSGGKVTAPVTIHMVAGSRRGGGVQHEGTPQAMLQNVPGLRVLAPGTPAEIDAALHIAMTGDDPTVIVDHVQLVDAPGPVPDAPAESLSVDLVRPGSDVLFVTYSLMVQRSLAAAHQLAAEGLSAGVLSVPCLNPLPAGPLLAALSEAEHVVFVDEACAAGSPASTMMALALDAGWPGRAALVAAAPAPAPHALHLLDAVIPTVARIADVARELIGP